VDQEPSSQPPTCDQFARWAPHYENGEVFSQLLLDLQRRAADWLRLGPDDRFLDVGCATGAAVRDAATMVELAMRADACSAMTEQAQALAYGRPRALFVVADAQHLPFPTASFSAVLCTTALRHFTDPGRAGAEMVRVLAPAGRIVVADLLEVEPRRRPPWSRYLQARAARASAGPLGAMSGTGASIVRPVECTTAIGRYLMVIAVKPKERRQPIGGCSMSASVGACVERSGSTSTKPIRLGTSSWRGTPPRLGDKAF
jgi:ubiquinone/menaquinone biosynthesis C-methylase UbiE